MSILRSALKKQGVAFLSAVIIKSVPYNFLNVTKIRVKDILGSPEGICVECSNDINC